MTKLSDQHPYIYHYTNLSGLRGIIEKKCIWATHYKFLNDAQEIIGFGSKLIEYLIPFMVDLLNGLADKSPDSSQRIERLGGLEAVARHEAETYVNAAYGAMGDLGAGLFIASFCGWNSEDDYVNQNGILSQWRAYGVGGGYAIEFRTVELQEALSIEADACHYSSIFLADVVYSDDDKKYKSEIELSLKFIAEHSREIGRAVLLRRSDPPPADQSFDPFVNGISRFKHRGFKEEREVRFVALPTALTPEYREIAGDKHCNSKQEKKCKFRDKNGLLVSYLELPLTVEKNLPISRIIVGPHKDKKERASSLRSMLEYAIDVTVSDIPYIG